MQQNLLPTGLGSKKQPVHFLVSHGSVTIRNPPAVDFQQLCSWFQESPDGRVEGIVWHCSNGTLVKVGGCDGAVLRLLVSLLESFCFCLLVCLQVHRHHLGLRWPDGDTFLANRPAVVHVDGTVDTYSSSSLLASFFAQNGRRFSRLQDVQLEL